MTQREVHLFLAPRSRTLRALRRLLPALQPNLNCDPHNIPEGSLCFTYPAERSRAFELAADARGVRYEWGGGGDVMTCVAILGDYLYALTTGLNLFRVWQIGAFGATTNKGSCALPGAPAALDVAGSVAYYTTTDGFFGRININDPNAPFLEPGSIVQTGERYDRIEVIGTTAFLSGPNTTLGVANYSLDVNEENPGVGATSRQDPIPVIAGNVSPQGRRVWFGSTSGSPRATLYGYRFGGFNCHAAIIDELQSEHITVERLDVRSLFAKGNIVTHGIVVAESGNGSFANFIRIGSLYLFWGSGDPNGSYTAPKSSEFWRTDGAINTFRYVNTDGATAWTAFA